MKVILNHQRLVGLRKKAKLTQKQFSERMGIVPKTCVMWELGKMTEGLHIDKIEKIADLYGVDITYLVSDDWQDAIMELQFTYEEAQRASDDPQERYENALKKARVLGVNLTTEQKEKKKREMNDIEKQLQTSIP